MEDPAARLETATALLAHGSDPNAALPGSSGGSGGGVTALLAAVEAKDAALVRVDDSPILLSGT